MSAGIDIELDGSEWSPGDRVSGHVAVERAAEAGQVRVNLSYVERLGGRRGRVLRDGPTAVVHTGPVTAGQRIAFALELANDAPANLGEGDNRRTWLVGARITGGGGRWYRSRDLVVTGATPDPNAQPAQGGSAETADGTSALTGWQGLRQRMAFGGKWAAASAILAGLSVYLVGFGAVLAAVDAAGADAYVLLGSGGLALLIGLAGLWLTVPAPASNLELWVDLPVTTPGGALCGTLVNQSLGQPVEVAAVCRGIRLHTGTGADDLSVSQSTVHCPAEVDPDTPRQRFRIELPRSVPVSGRRLGSATWWMMARRPGRPRAAVVLVPVTVRR